MIPAQGRQEGSLWVDQGKEALAGLVGGRLEELLTTDRAAILWPMLASYPVRSIQAAIGNSFSLTVLHTCNLATNRRADEASKKCKQRHPD